MNRKQKQQKRKNKNKANKRKAKNNRNSIAPSIGESVGGYFGPLGARIGRGIGNLISTVSGYGDYKINSNTLLANDVPVFSGALSKVNIKHREFIADVQGSVDFRLTAYPINPGMYNTFPWLSGVAHNFDQYKFNGLLFEFKTTSGNVVSGNAALGAVVMATDYNAAEPNFPEKRAMEASQYSCSTVPSMSLIHPIECSRAQTVLPLNYVRSATPTVGEDIRLYDLGKFEIATIGQQAGVTTVGELWVTYDIDLFKPVLEYLLPGPFTHIEESPASTASAIVPFGTNGGVAVGSVEIAPLTPAGFGIPQPGTYIIYCVWTAPGLNIAALPGVVLGANIQFTPAPFNQHTTNLVRNFNTAYGFMSFMVTVTLAGIAAANFLTFNGLTGMTGGQCDIFIHRMAQGVNP